ncbi:MAG: trypsin-like serine protease [Ruminococcus sp.]|nr:trypsin-like serine protease [Ruminococcus sp.]
MNAIVYKSRKIISVIVAAVMFIICITYNNILETSAVNTALNYKVFNASNGNYMSTYTLSANAVQDNSRSVIELDTRVVDFTKSGVVKIIMNSGSFSTGFVVDGNTIATAAHCVANKTSDGNAASCGDSINKILIFDANGNIELTITNAYSVHIPSLYFSTYGNTNEYDYALITIPEVDTETRDLSNYAIFNLGIMLDGFKNSGKTISITGFPKEVNDEIVNDCISKHTMYEGTGQVGEKYANSDFIFGYTCDTSGGNSGGPVYTTVAYGGNVYYTVIGIHTTGAGTFNAATRITTDLLHFYKNNPNI